MQRASPRRFSAEEKTEFLRWLAYPQQAAASGVSAPMLCLRGGQVPRPVLFVLDEAANIGRWPELPDEGREPRAGVAGLLPCLTLTPPQRATATTSSRNSFGHAAGIAASFKQPPGATGQVSTALNAHRKGPTRMSPVLNQMRQVTQAIEGAETSRNEPRVE